MSLSGKRIVITRAPHQAAEFEVMLSARGAITLLYPCIEIAPPEDTTILDNAILSLHTFNWLLLTSTNTVYALQNRFKALNLTQMPTHLRIAAVGTSTAGEAETAFGIRPEVLPDEFTATALAAALKDHLSAGSRFLLPQSEIARPDLAQKLMASGAHVVTVTAYRTITGTGGADLPALIHSVDAITFTSPSTVEQFLTRMGGLSGMAGICVVCIGSVTADAARKQGFRNIIVPQEFTLNGMISALEAYFSG